MFLKLWMRFFKMSSFCVVGDGLAGHLLVATLTQAGHRVYWACSPCQSQRSFHGNNVPHLVLNASAERRLMAMVPSLKLSSLGHRLTSFKLYYEKALLLHLQAQQWERSSFGYQVSIPLLFEHLKQSIDNTLLETLCSKSLFEHFSGQNTENIFPKEPKKPYILVADGQHSLWRDKILKKPFQWYEQTQSSLSLVIELPQLSSSYQASQMIVGPFTLGVIPQSSYILTIVVTGAEDNIADLNSYDDRMLLEKIRQFCSFKDLDFQQAKLISRQTPKALANYSVQEALGKQIGLFGLAARGLHPAAALGFNQIIYEVALFQHFCQYKSEDVSSWFQVYNQQAYKRFELAHQKVLSLTRPARRSVLPYLPLQQLSEIFLPFSLL